MYHLLGYNNNLYASFEDPVAGYERPYNEWNEFITSVVHEAWGSMNSASLGLIQFE